MWGCTPHWYALPASLRAAIWRAYVPGQEVTQSPSKEYLAVARQVEDWIREHLAKRSQTVKTPRPASAQGDLFGDAGSQAARAPT